MDTKDWICLSASVNNNRVGDPLIHGRNSIARVELVEWPALETRQVTEKNAEGAKG